MADLSMEIYLLLFVKVTCKQSIKVTYQMFRVHGFMFVEARD